MLRGIDMTDTDSRDPVAAGLLRSAVAVFGGATLVAVLVFALRGKSASAAAASPPAPAADARGTSFVAPAGQPVAASEKSSDVAAPTTADGTTKVSLAYLANFTYDPPQLEYDAAGKAKMPATDTVPKSVRALSGRRVAVDGYMAPIDFENGTCSKFALMPALPTCCYGCAMTGNNWIAVTMKSGTRADCVAPYSVHVEGVLAVNGLDDELSPLYTLTAETATAVTQ